MPHPGSKWYLVRFGCTFYWVVDCGSVLSSSERVLFVVQAGHYQCVKMALLQPIFVKIRHW